MTFLPLQQAEQIARKSLSVSRKRKLPPMGVAVVDAGGHLQYGVREDGSGLAGIDIAAAKARAAVMFGCSSREIAGALAGNPQASASVLALFPGRIMLLAGAVLIRGEGGMILGAVGAAGGAPDDDEAVAAAGAG